jgi:hypothetical protein
MTTTNEASPVDLQALDRAIDMLEGAQRSTCTAHAIAPRSPPMPDDAPANPHPPSAVVTRSHREDAARHVIARYPFHASWVREQLERWIGDDVEIDLDPAFRADAVGIASLLAAREATLTAERDGARRERDAHAKLAGMWAKENVRAWTAEARLASLGTCFDAAVAARDAALAESAAMRADISTLKEYALRSAHAIGICYEADYVHEPGPIEAVEAWAKDLREDHDEMLEIRLALADAGAHPPADGSAIDAVRALLAALAAVERAVAIEHAAFALYEAEVEEVVESRHWNDLTYALQEARRARGEPWPPVATPASSAPGGAREDDWTEADEVACPHGNMHLGPCFGRGRRRCGPTCQCDCHSSAEKAGGGE